MKNSFVVASFVIFVCVGALIPSASAQAEQINNDRKVINRVTPEYPRLARTMNLRGTVRLEVHVNEAGRVKSVEVKGGSPVLIQSAQDAVRMWKWEKAERETTELVEFNFN
jgi:TonB family protein